MDRHVFEARALNFARTFDSAKNANDFKIALMEFQNLVEDIKADETAEPVERERQRKVLWKISKIVNEVFIDSLAGSDMAGEA